MKIQLFEKQCRNEEDLLTLAAQLARTIKPGTVIFLLGPLGAGKTTFTRGFLRGLGYEGKVKSPTYTLVETYDLPEHTVCHFDFYRLKQAKELEFIGIQDYFSPATICLMEWADKGDGFLPPPDLTCSIAFAGEGRAVLLKARTEKGEAILTKLNQP